MKINIPNDVSLILNEIENNGYEAIVGGCVRDSLLDKAPNDWTYVQCKPTRY